MIKVIVELKSIADFKAWSGGRDAIEDFIERGIVDEVSSLLADYEPDGWDEMNLNDFIWFGRSYIFECLGLKEEEDF